MYTDTSNILCINQVLTSRFQSEIGVKQGDNLSPSYFCQFINTLIKELQQLNVGIDIGSWTLSCLAYADDIVLLAENVKDLDKLLCALEKWCSRWRVLINMNKMNIMHFRRRQIKQSTFSFRVGNTVFETVDKYKYLGTTIGCFPNDGVITEELSKSGSRALRQIISKTKSNLDVGYKTFTRLFHSGVAPILDYGSGVWCIGNSVNCEKLDKIEQREVKYFVGLPKNSPILTLTGDMGWTPGIVHRDVEVLQLYNQIVQMPSHCITRQVFDFDKKCDNQTWSKNIISLCESLGELDSWEQELPINIAVARSMLMEMYVEVWKEQVVNKPKLYLYQQIKQDLRLAEYLTANLPKNR